MQLFTKNQSQTQSKKPHRNIQNRKSNAKSSFIKTFIFIPASDTLLLVIPPLLTSFVQSPITNPTRMTCTAILFLACAVIVLGLYINIHDTITYSRHEEL